MADTIKLYRTCPICKQDSTIEMPTGAFDKWQDGALIQVAWPKSTNDERERALTGIHGKCYDDAFPEEDEDVYSDDDEFDAGD